MKRDELFDAVRNLWKWIAVAAVVLVVILVLTLGTGLPSEIRSDLLSLPNTTIVKYERHYLRGDFVRGRYFVTVHNPAFGAPFVVMYSYKNGKWVRGDNVIDDFRRRPSPHEKES